jgi:hypothetical protein
MTLSNLNPLDFPEDWHRFSVAGVTWGKDLAEGAYCVVSDAVREHKYDDKEGKGTVGGTSTFVNLPPAEFDVTFYLWSFDHFVGWDVFVLLLRYDPTKTKAQSQAQDVFYPSLSANQITSATVRKIGSCTHLGKGLYSIKVSFKEFRPAGKSSAVSTPSGSSGTSPKWVKAPYNKPGDSADPAIAEAQAEAKKLAEEGQDASQ